jgi:proline-specific peptidase
MPKVQLGNQVINYVEKGFGDPIFLLHGVGMDHTMWHNQIDFLSISHRVIAFDMIGHGESAKPEKSYCLKDFVQQLYTLMNHLEIDQAHIVGFSMGGMVAQLFGIIYPEKCKSLCFMSAVANRTKEQQQTVINRVRQVEREGHLATINAAISRWFNDSFYHQHPEIIKSVKNRLETNDPKSYLKAYTVFATADQELWEKLDQISCPTLIITGENDIGSSPEMAQQMKGKIKSSELIIVPSIRHMLPIEGKEAVNKALQTFVSKHSN